MDVESSLRHPGSKSFATGPERYRAAKGQERLGHLWQRADVDRTERFEPLIPCSKLLHALMDCMHDALQKLVMFPIETTF